MQSHHLNPKGIGWNEVRDPPELEITGIIDRYIYMLNGTKWRLLLGEDMGGSRCRLMEGQKTLSCYKPSWTEGLTKDDTGGSQTEQRNVPRTERRASPLCQVDPHSYSRVT
jgi:hypothetical protein